MFSERRQIRLCILLGVIFFLLHGPVHAAGPTILPGFPISTDPDTKAQYHSHIAGGAAYDGMNYLVGIEEDVRMKSDCPDATSIAAAQFVSPSGKLIGPLISAGTTGGTPQVAFDGTNYLMVWESNGTYSTHIYAHLIDTNGTLVGSEITVGSGGDMRLGFNSILFDGTNYFVVWQDNSTPGDGDTGHIFGQFIKPSGALLGSAIQISKAQYGQIEPTLAFDGTNILAAWVDGRNRSACHTNSSGVHCFESDVYGQFVTNSSSGSPALKGGNFAISESSLPRNNPITAAFDGKNYCIVFTEETTLPNACPKTGCKWNAYGQFVTKAGARTGSKITIGNTASSYFAAGAVWVGDRYLAAWTENYDTPAAVAKGRYFDGTGAPLGSEFTLFSKSSAGAIPSFAFILPGGANQLAVATRVMPGETTLCSANVDVYGAFVNTPSVGSLKVTITSNPAGLAGAKWRVDDGAWQNSGATVGDLVPGEHDVTFKPVTDWTTPPKQTVNIVNGETKSLSIVWYSKDTILGICEPEEDFKNWPCWKVNDGSGWHTSGTTIYVLPGQYTGSWRSQTGFVTPPDSTCPPHPPGYGWSCDLTGVYAIGPMVMNGGSHFTSPSGCCPVTKYCQQPMTFPSFWFAFYASGEVGATAAFGLPSGPFTLTQALTPDCGTWHAAGGGCVRSTGDPLQTYVKVSGAGYADSVCTPYSPIPWAQVQQTDHYGRVDSTGHVQLQQICFFGCTSEAW
jgi:hypothetical protein